MNTEFLLTQSWDDFVSKINNFMDELGIEKDEFECDHAAIRVNTQKHADQLRAFFETKGKVISENFINGRPILIIELNEPLMLNGTQVPYVELPYPSEKAYPFEGWEHIELVVPGKASTVESLIESSIASIPKIEKAINGQLTEIKLKQSSPKGEKERLPNPTIALKKADICVKLHSHSIKAIIESEL
ncbi:VOC family protein [Shewanella sp. 202IG2-18]|uniref:VOC family protein n=1 Tax=Parashewanella hymeniacidonis TaxID=2807618 RepID=UPI0019605350|nr:VOC family protein [Parashewanella hymeniacidonis]MBM7073981.1 VOC family protein [Parashewanella hymeniacidonis]